jgi:hypothetical protein
MKFNFDTTLDYFIFFIVLIKIVFVLSAIGHIFLTYFAKNKHFVEQVDPQLLYWKERTEFVFIASMAILLIYHFKPGRNRTVSSESALLFFLFGWILLATAKWELFFTESNWYKKIVSSLR